jgi:hypothetical protein
MPLFLGLSTAAAGNLMPRQGNIEVPAAPPRDRPTMRTTLRPRSDFRAFHYERLVQYPVIRWRSRNPTALRAYEFAYSATSLDGRRLDERVSYQGLDKSLDLPRRQLREFHMHQHVTSGCEHTSLILC